MGVRWPSNGNSNAGGLVIPATVPTVALLSAPLNLSIDNQQVLLQWYLAVTWGGDITSVVLKIIRGSTAGGTLLNSGVTVQVTSADTLVLGGCWTDIPGIVANQQYAVTLTTAGGVADSTVADASIALIAL